MSELTSLERQVIEALLSGDNEVLAALRQQAHMMQVKSREMTGVGFFTEFAVPPEAPFATARPTFKLGSMNGTAENVKQGLGFLLYVENGVLTMLEGYTYDEPWPDEVHGLLLTSRTDEVPGGPNIEP